VNGSVVGRPQNLIDQLRGDLEKHLQERVRSSYNGEGTSIPQVTIKTGLKTPDGGEELLTEYLCDHPGCPNIATHALGFVREVGAKAAVCDEHAPKPRS
jgi:hypothetical protein